MKIERLNESNDSDDKFGSLTDILKRKYLEM
jgi:hypothetical protein